MITRSILQVGAIGVINKDENLKLPISELKNTLDSAMGSMRKSVHDLHDESVDLKVALKAALNRHRMILLMYLSMIVEQMCREILNMRLSP